MVFWKKANDMTHCVQLLFTLHLCAPFMNGRGKRKRVQIALIMENPATRQTVVRSHQVYSFLKILNELKICKLQDIFLGQQIKKNFPLNSQNFFFKYLPQCVTTNQVEPVLNFQLDENKTKRLIQNIYLPQQTQQCLSRIVNTGVSLKEGLIMCKMQYVYPT